MNAKDRLAQITREIAELEAERTRLAAAMQEPNNGAIVRWFDDLFYRCARRNGDLWFITGITPGFSWDQLLDQVGGARLEIADSFSTYLPEVGTRPCPECGQSKPDVRRRMDPYDREINGFERYMEMCGSCEAQRADDI